MAGNRSGDTLRMGSFKVVELDEKEEGAPLSVGTTVAWLILGGWLEALLEIRLAIPRCPGWGPCPWTQRWPASNCSGTLTWRRGSQLGTQMWATQETALGVGMASWGWARDWRAHCSICNSQQPSRIVYFCDYLIFFLDLCENSLSLSCYSRSTTTNSV